MRKGQVPPAGLILILFVLLTTGIWMMQPSKQSHTTHIDGITVELVNKTELESKWDYTVVGLADTDENRISLATDLPRIGVFGVCNHEMQHIHMNENRFAQYTHHDNMTWIQDQGLVIDPVCIKLLPEL